LTGPIFLLLGLNTTVISRRCLRRLLGLLGVDDLVGLGFLHWGGSFLSPIKLDLKLVQNALDRNVVLISFIFKFEVFDQTELAVALAALRASPKHCLFRLLIVLAAVLATGISLVSCLCLVDVEVDVIVVVNNMQWWLHIEPSSLTLFVRALELV